jgi:hypothetical protein
VPLEHDLDRSVVAVRPDVVGQPPGVADRREHVVESVPDKNGGCYRGELELPRPAQCESVVNPAVCAVLERFVIGVCQQPLNSNLVDDPPVSRGELRPEFS